jgi:uncharacterized Zn-finger protein
MLWESRSAAIKVRGVLTVRRLSIASHVHSTKGEHMADHVVPHFHNDAGVAVIEIGSQEFMCVGANPPFDHPHVFLDLGNDNEIICPYCSTLYRYAADLGAGEARPPECVLKDKVA